MASNAVCRQCGSSALEPGDLIEPFNRAEILFRPHAKRFFTLRPGIAVSASVCMSCGCLQMHADVQAVAAMLKDEKSCSAEELEPAESIECLDCGAAIEANESKCPKCGWSYKE